MAGLASQHWGHWDRKTASLRPAWTGESDSARKNTCCSNRSTHIHNPCAHGRARRFHPSIGNVVYYVATPHSSSPSDKLLTTSKRSPVLDTFCKQSQEVHCVWLLSLILGCIQRFTQPALCSFLEQKSCTVAWLQVTQPSWRVVSCPGDWQAQRINSQGKKGRHTSTNC